MLFGKNAVSRSIFVKAVSLFIVQTFIISTIAFAAPADRFSTMGTAHSKTTTLAPIVLSEHAAQSEDEMRASLGSMKGVSGPELDGVIEDLIGRVENARNGYWRLNVSIWIRKALDIAHKNNLPCNVEMARRAYITGMTNAAIKARMSEKGATELTQSEEAAIRDDINKIWSDHKINEAFAQIYNSVESRRDGMPEPVEYFSGGAQVDFTEWQYDPDNRDRIMMIANQSIQAVRNAANGMFDIHSGGLIQVNRNPDPADVEIFETDFAELRHALAGFSGRFGGLSIVEVSAAREASVELLALRARLDNLAVSKGVQENDVPAIETAMDEVQKLSAAFIGFFKDRLAANPEVMPELIGLYLADAVDGDENAYNAIRSIDRETLVAYFEEDLPAVLEALPADIFGYNVAEGKGNGYDLRGNAQAIQGGIVDLTPVNVYAIAKLIASYKASPGDRGLITGDIRLHTPILRYVMALGAASVGVEIDYSEDYFTTGAHNLLATENPKDHKFMIQISGSHGASPKNGMKVKADMGRKDDKGNALLEPLYGDDLGRLWVMRHAVGPYVFKPGDINVAKIKKLLSDDTKNNAIILSRLGLTEEQLEAISEQDLLAAFNNLLLDRSLTTAAQSPSMSTEQDYMRVNRSLLENLYPAAIRQASVPEDMKLAGISIKTGLLDFVVDMLNITLPQVKSDEIVVVDSRAGAAGALILPLLQKRGFEIIDMDTTSKDDLINKVTELWNAGKRQIAIMLNVHPDGLMRRGIWDPSRPEALKPTQELVNLLNGNLIEGMPKAIGAVFDGDADRISAILENGYAVPAFEMTLPYYQRFLRNPENMEVIERLMREKSDPVRVVCDVRANSKLLSLINEVNATLKERLGDELKGKDAVIGQFITTGYPPQLGFMQLRIEELDKFVNGNPNLTSDADFMEKFANFKKTYFTAEASGHNFFHVSKRYPNRVCDCAIAGFFTLVGIRETIGEYEAPLLKLPETERYELAELFSYFPGAYSSREVNAKIPNSIKVSTARTIGEWLKEHYGAELKEGGKPFDERGGEYLVQGKDEGYVLVSGYKAQLKDGRAALVRWSNTGEYLTTIFEGHDLPSLISIITEVADRMRQEHALNMEDLDKEIARLNFILETQKAVAVSINKVKLLDDMAESAGLSKDQAFANMTAAGLVLPGGTVNSYETILDIFNVAKLRAFLNAQLSTLEKSSPVSKELADLTVLRMERIILNAVDVDSFIGNLAAASEKTPLAVIGELKEQGLFPTLVAAWELDNALKNPLAVGSAPFTVEEIFNPAESTRFYRDNNVEVEFSLPEGVEVNKDQLNALVEYQRIMSRDMSRGQFNYRGSGTKQTVEQFFNDYFMKEWYPKIRKFIEDRFNGGKDLDFIVTNGIGANDQFMWSLARMYNINKPEGAPKWIHIPMAGGLVELEGANPDRVLFIDISRSGGTWEGVEVGLRSLQMGFTKRIGLANGGAVAAIAKKAAEMGGYEPLIIPMSPDIGGRNMHRKTSIYYTAQTVAGIFLPSMDSKVFAALNDKFDKANDFASPNKNVAVSAGRFLHAAMKLFGAEHIAAITNSESLRLAMTEWEQYIMEGSNKGDVISMGIHDLTTEPDYVLGNMARSPAGKMTVGMVILDQAVATYAKDLARVNELKKTIPMMVMTIDSKEAEAKKGGLSGGISPNQQAAFDILWTDLVTVFTTLLRVDANSNPNVKKVREYTAQRVADWKTAEANYETDALRKGETELLMSYGTPKEPAIGSEGKQETMTMANAAQKGAGLAIELAQKGALDGRSRLNLFVGRQDLMPMVSELRNATYQSELLADFGWITQTALFPLWSHKGLEANLAYSANPETPLLANKTIDIFFNARQAGTASLLNQGFDNLGVMDAKYQGIKGATIHQTNDAMTLPNIKRMAEVSPTILFEFNDKSEDVEAMIRVFYAAFIDQLARELAKLPPTAPKTGSGKDARTPKTASHATKAGEPEKETQKIGGPAQGQASAEGPNAGKVVPETAASRVVYDFSATAVTGNDNISGKAVEKYVDATAKSLFATLSQIKMTPGEADKGVVIVAYDTGMTKHDTNGKPDAATQPVAKEAIDLVDQTLGDKIVVNVTGTGAGLLESINSAMQTVSDSGLKLRSVVVMAGNQTMQDVSTGKNIGDELINLAEANNGKVLNILDDQARIIPVAALYELAIIVGFRLDEKLPACLSSIGIALGADNMPIDPAKFFTERIIRILPAIGPVKTSDQVQAQKAAQAALRSL